MPSERRVLRCAVYTRKSSEHGLEQDFNSLDAQREAGEAYIKSQSHEGWKLIRARYADGGLSGATMERPALQRLLADIETRLIDAVVVYKVDRLTRSLADFAKLIESFEAQLPKSVARELDRLFDRALPGSSGSGGQDGTGAHRAAHKRNGQSPKLTRPGTILVREWQGTTHQVTVMADGFLWNGRAHNSLSGIARAITGTKWSGPRFFGMREPNDAL